MVYFWYCSFQNTRLIQRPLLSRKASYFQPAAKNLFEFALNAEVYLVCLTRTEGVGCLL